MKINYNPILWLSKKVESYRRKRFLRLSSIRATIKRQNIKFSPKRNKQVGLK